MTLYFYTRKNKDGSEQKKSRCWHHGGGVWQLFGYERSDVQQTNSMFFMYKSAKTLYEQKGAFRFYH